MNQNELEKMEKTAAKGRKLLGEIFELKKSLNGFKASNHGCTFITQKHDINIRIKYLTKEEMNVVENLVQNRLIGLERDFDLLKVK